MRSPRTALSLFVVIALALLVSGCGAGGFGSGLPTQRDVSITKYAALGDGFTAAPYIGETTAKDGCLRSAGNYPSLLAAELSVNEFTDVSCFGTGTKALTQSVKSPTTKKPLPAQIKAVDAATDLITIGSGIADRNLLNSLFNVCLTFPPCGDKITVKEIEGQLETLEASMVSAIRDIQEQAPRAYIVVVGYPQLIPTQDSCSQLPDLAPAALDAAYIVLQRINSALQSAAQQTGGVFLNVAAISGNHHVCADEPWAYGSKDISGKQKAYHPTAAEQQAVADAILARIRSR